MGFPRARKSADSEHPHDLGAVQSAALALLARRDYASGELHERLQAKGYDGAMAATVIAELMASGALNDARFAEHYVAHHAERGQGPVRIRADLKARKLPGELIDAAVGEGREWRERAQKVRLRKFGRVLPESWREKSRQARFLQYRGFSSDHIRAALGTDFNWDADT
jgi:regulatory protein